MEDEVELDLSEADWTLTEDPNAPDWDNLDNMDEPDPVEYVKPMPDYKTDWGEIDAAALVRGELDESPPSLLKRSDGPHLLYRGKVHSIAGEPESGKGWFALLAATQAIADGYHVVYIDFEDTPQGVFNRLRLLGMPVQVAAEKFHYIRPSIPLVWKNEPNANPARSNVTWQDLVATLVRASESQGGLGLIVFDGITEALGLQGILGKDNEDVAAWFGDVPRRLAHASKAAVLLIDHVVKSTDDRGRYAIGAQAKLSALDGCQFLAQQKMAFARGRSGVTRISVAKDRPGYVRQVAATGGSISPVADMIVTAKDDGALALALVEPDIQTNADGHVKPTGIQNEIVKYLTRVKGQSRQRQVILDAVRGKTATKRQAFNDMIDNGWLVEVKNGRKTEFRLGAPKDVC